MASGWYMPSIAELCKIYQNLEAVNNLLQHMCRLDEQAAMNGLETNWYWSASQAASSDDSAWFVHYFNDAGLNPDFLCGRHFGCQVHADREEESGKIGVTRFMCSL